MGYYGLLVPNTAVAKESGRAVWERGREYLVDFVQPHLLWIPLLFALGVLTVVLPRVGWRRTELLLVVAVEVAALAHTAYVVRVGGDFMHGRFLLPSLFLLLCPVMAVPLLGPAWRGVAVTVGAAALVAWCAVSALVLRPDYLGSVGPAGIADERSYWAAMAGKEHPVTLTDHGRDSVIPYSDQVATLQDEGADVIVAQLPVATAETLVARVAPSSGGVVFAVGNAGFYGVAPGLAVRVVDGLGLTDPIGSHMEAPPPGRAGHEKQLPPAWLLARYGAPELATRTTAGLPAAADVATARATLACGPVRELLEATNEPMSWGRFWDNLTGARSRTSLRIPAAPAEAHERFC
jgi:arabinofuranosyltransferase